MIAVISGATGLVGSILIRKLLEHSQFNQVISVSRRTTGIQSPKLQEILISDMSELSQQREKLKGDIYYCCLGTTIKDAGSQENFKKIDFEAIVDFAEIAKSHDAKSFVLISASGASLKSRIFYSRIKGLTEDTLKKMNFKKLMIFKPALLMGERIAFRRGERLMIQVLGKLSPLLPRVVERNLMTDCDHLAQRMLSESLASDKSLTVLEAADI